MKVSEIDLLREARKRDMIANAGVAENCHLPGHGTMAMRSLEPQTYEQLWCGVWLDCVAPGCGSSRLLVSDELKAQNARFLSRASQSELSFEAPPRKRGRKP